MQERLFLIRVRFEPRPPYSIEQDDLSTVISTLPHDMFRLIPIESREWGNSRGNPQDFVDVVTRRLSPPSINYWYTSRHHVSLHTEVGIKPIGPPPQHETDLLDLTYNILPVALPTGLQHSLKFLTKTRFKLYLQANVTNSH